MTTGAMVDYGGEVMRGAVARRWRRRHDGGERSEMDKVRGIVVRVIEVARH